MNRSDIPTPALLVDVPAMERNIARMARFFAAVPCKLRPHFKAHKTPEIARRQLAAGSCIGLTCATIGEAEVAIHQISEIVPVKGAVLVGPLPADVQNFTTYSAGLGAAARDAAAAKALIQFIAGPASAPILKAKGMEKP